MSVYGQRDWGWICPKCQASNAPTLQHCTCSHQPQPSAIADVYGVDSTGKRMAKPILPSSSLERIQIRGNPIKLQPFLEGENPLCQ